MSIASPTPPSSAPLFSACVRAAVAAENALAAAALATMALLPVLEILLRNLFGQGIPGTAGYVGHLTLWVGFLGAMVAARRREHLNLSTRSLRRWPRLAAAAPVLAGAVSTAVAAGLSWASLQFVLAEVDSPGFLGGWLPIWVAESILPISFATMALRFVLHAGCPTARAGALLGLPLAAAIGFLLAGCPQQILWPGIIALLLAVPLGVPIFVVLGGAALLLFFAEGVPVAAIPVEAYRIVASPSIPTIPLFTLAGYLLAEGGAGGRLVRLFRAWFGWLPGGTAIVATLVCGFFSSFTGASGVTILALGGVLLPVLVKSGYDERFALGVVTSTGSIGLLFPPSLAVILYGVVAHISIPELFRAAVVPGALMVASVCAYGVFKGLAAETERPRFRLSLAGAALWDAKWEVLVPIVALFGIFGGFSTLTEAAAVTAVYVCVVQCIIHRDLALMRDVPAVLLKSATLIGGVFVILAAAMGLTSYLVDAEIPTQAAAWVQANIGSRTLFLLALNLFLLVVGCLDGISAIIIAVPLVQPISQAFGIDPLRLAVIFLVNLELGFLMPPVGMNLFLASYRFGRPLATIYRSALPFLTILLLVVLLVTYVPALTLAVGSGPP